MGNIAVLEPQVVAKIAAGEVIERPSAVVRELLDNSIDAGATQISLHLEEGGVQLVRVSDDGIGMNREDLELCYLPYATSKIRETNDLLKLCSLGFRGEALSSIAACSKLRIRSAQESESTSTNETNGWELRIDDSIFQSIESSPAVSPGTQIEVRDLFYTFPARRKFLKSTRSELSSCKAIFCEKALAFPHIHFRLYNSGKMEQSLTPGSPIERICQIYGELVPEQLFALEEQTQSFRFTLFAAPPNIYRRDRKRMPIFVNQRPISEASLQYAIRIGYEGYLAGGLFPACFCFLEIVPDRVDFNIHPAKREARMRDLNLIQGAIRQTLRNFCREYGSLSTNKTQANEQAEQSLLGLAERNQAERNNQAEHDPAERDKAERATPFHFKAPNRPSPSYNSRSFSGSSNPSSYSTNSEGAYTNSFSARDIAGNTAGDMKHSPKNNPMGQSPSSAQDLSSQREAFHSEFHYYGQLFEVFLLVERTLDGIPQFLIVDQHASHERILYETLQKEMLQKQALLVPIELEVDPAQEASLVQRIESLASIGIQIEKQTEKQAEKQAEKTERTQKSAPDVPNWQITTLPPSVGDLKEELIELILHGSSEAEDLKRELFAHLSCHKAIKKGDILDDISAAKLLETLFSMGLEHCPHGRPLWYSLSQQDLYRLLQRT